MAGTRANGLIENPDFRPDALPGGLEAEWERMRGRPTGLARPLVMFSGWRALGFPVKALGGRPADLAGADVCGLLRSSVVRWHSFGRACRRAVAEVGGRWRSCGREQAVGVGGVRGCMGGGVAR